MTSPSARTRELAERTSNGTRVRLLWRQASGEVWVEVSEREVDLTIAFPVPPERALDAFHHPYAYAASHGAPAQAEALAA